MSSRNSELNSVGGWKKSTHSGGEANCVDVNLMLGPKVGIRDTKDGGTGHVVLVDRDRFGAFLAGAKAGKFTAA